MNWLQFPILLCALIIIASCNTDGVSNDSRQYEGRFTIPCVTKDGKTIEVTLRYFYKFYSKTDMLFTEQGYFRNKKDSIFPPFEPVLYLATRKIVEQYDSNAIKMNRTELSSFENEIYGASKEYLGKLFEKNQVNLQLNDVLFNSKKVELTIESSRVISHEVDPSKGTLRFFLKNGNDENYSNFNNLKLELKKSNKQLLFAMNGGMYQKDLSPQGLYIEKGQLLSKLDTSTTGYGNFFLQPNGVFYLTQDLKPLICSTTNFKLSKDVLYATQSGPMLVIDGKIHDKLTKGSENVHIRNGVGLLPNGNLLFAISNEKINFFDFASFFKDRGCRNALYLDGFVSKIYLPSQGIEQMDGSFGVIISEVEEIP